MDKLTKKGLDGTQLKTIALVLMVLDHIHYFFEFTGWVPTWFSMLGRLSAPLFLFCTVEGFAHTHDRRRYFIRIWAIGTAMAALEFFMIYAKAFRRGDGFYPLNAIFQDLMLLCIVWQGIDWLREKKWGRGVAAIAAVAGWPFVIMAFLSAFPQIQQMPWASTVVAFVINYACYFSEIYRGGIESVPVGQTEAGQVLGMTKSQIFFRVTLLQVIKRILAPMGNEVMTLIKDTSLANVIANKEIIMMAKEYSAKGLIWPLFSTALFFLVFVGAMTLLFNWLEKKLSYFR